MMILNSTINYNFNTYNVRYDSQYPITEMFGIQTSTLNDDYKPKKKLSLISTVIHKFKMYNMRFTSQYPIT